MAHARRKAGLTSAAPKRLSSQALDIFFPIIGTAGMGKGKAASFPITCWFAQVSQY